MMNIKKIYTCGFCGSPCYKSGEYIGVIPENYNPSDYEGIACCECLQQEADRDMQMIYDDTTKYNVFYVQHEKER